MVETTRSRGQLFHEQIPGSWASCATTVSLKSTVHFNVVLHD
jgi:hypothetical protein